MNGHDGCRVRLVHIEEAAEMDATNVQPADADRSIRERLKFDGQTRLDTVGILAISIEAHDHGRSEESAIGDGCTARERIREGIRGVVRISAVLYKAL